jgi:hypothetical protein
VTHDLECSSVAALGVARANLKPGQLKRRPSLNTNTHVVVERGLVLLACVEQAVDVT